MKYSKLTVGTLLKELQRVAEKYGEDIPVYTGDFEGNYLHGKHESCYYTEDKCFVLNYEMHESIWEY